MENRRLRTWELAALLALCVTLLWGTWAGARQQRLAAGLVRLHVIAVSDDAAEQALKLRVRDAVLDYLRPRLQGVGDPVQARALLEAELAGVAAAAESASEGRPVSVSLGRETYPLRRYGGFTLPAGRYESLRVVLGAGEGHNRRTTPWSPGRRATSCASGWWSSGASCDTPLAEGGGTSAPLPALFPAKARKTLKTPGFYDA